MANRKDYYCWFGYKLHAAYLAHTIIMYAMTFHAAARTDGFIGNDFSIEYDLAFRLAEINEPDAVFFKFSCY